MPISDDAPLSSSVRRREIVFYALTVSAAIVIFLVIRAVGQRNEPLEVATAVPSGSPQSISALFQVLLALGTIIVTTRLVGVLFGRIAQPLVIGELVGGIILGPSLLGRLAPGVQAALLPQSIAPYLSVHAQLGVILYMFLVGLELDLGVIRHQGRATIAISHASIVVPFLLGAALSLAIYPEQAGSPVSFTVFSLFIGVSLSVTAFPVLARILTDRRIARTRMGIIALTCAAVDDATAWCLLAMVVSIAHARGWTAVVTILVTMTFVILVLTVAMPIVHRLFERYDRAPTMTPAGHLSVVLVAVLAAAVATEYIGIHALFGAFLFGAIIPSQTRTAAKLRDRLESLVSALFLPVFFAFTGLRTEIGLIDSVQGWLLCGAIILVACAGKFGGSLLASRVVGLNWRDSAALSVLMNTRGLVELIVLNIGLDLKIISPQLFTMLVLMALVTTFMTSPILELLLRHHPWVEASARPARSALQPHKA
jgi:Kef-type K+ transport system membrane component KefB